MEENERLSRQLLGKIRAYIGINGDDPQGYIDYFDAVILHKRINKEDAYQKNLWLRNVLTSKVKKRGLDPKLKKTFYELLKKTYFIMATDDFHSYLVYTEWNREPRKKFYIPRMNYLSPVVEGYQKCADGELDLLTVSLPKRCGKSQIGINFVCFMSGRNPNGSTLMEGAGSALVDSFYKGVNEYLEPESEYLYYEIFPDAKRVSQSAEMRTVNLFQQTRFPTIMCRSLDATQVGLSEATNVLYIDDPVESREEAKNRARLDNLWDGIRGDVLGRRIEGTPIVAAGTRYSLYDPIGRLQQHGTDVGWRTKYVEIPALDPITDESNFEHIKDGRKVFTTEYLRKERQLVSEEQWMSEFQQQPFEARGIMFSENSLNRYFELPTDRDPDTVIAVCDTAESGEDSTMMPIAYVYGTDVFIEDVVFDNSTPEFTKPQCAKMLHKHNVVRCTFESNLAGTYFARDVETLLKELGGNCSIRTKRTVTNKQTRIEMASDGIVKNFYFKDKSLYKPNDQYGMMMKELVTYTRTGKVAHDDAPDGLSLLENEIRTAIPTKIEFERRFW